MLEKSNLRSKYVYINSEDAIALRMPGAVLHVAVLYFLSQLRLHIVCFTFSLHKKKYHIRRIFRYV